MNRTRTLAHEMKTANTKRRSELDVRRTGNASRLRRCGLKYADDDDDNYNDNDAKLTLLNSEISETFQKTH